MGQWLRARAVGMNKGIFLRDFYNSGNAILSKVFFGKTFERMLFGRCCEAIRLQIVKIINFVSAGGQFGSVLCWECHSWIVGKTNYG